jgi:hypothetical protein
MYDQEKTRVTEDMISLGYNTFKLNSMNLTHYREEGKVEGQFFVKNAGT